MPEGRRLKEELPHIRVREGGQEELPRCPRSGAEAGRTPCLEGQRQEELTHIRVRGGRPGRSYHVRGQGKAAQMSYLASEVRGGSQNASLQQRRSSGESHPRLRSGQQLRGVTPRSKERWLRGLRRPRAILSFKVRRAAVRDTLSKVRNSGCALLDQP